MNNDSRTLHLRTLNYINLKRLWAVEQPVVLSVSGGVDSMVLLDIVVRTQGAHRGKMRVVTFDHGLRAESEQEVEMVRQIACEHNLTCDVHSLNLEKGSHLQERARIKRREILTGYTNHVIATAHHANDQAETVLYRLMRGTGLTGIRAMLPKQYQFVRPLLFAFKEEIIAYAELRKIPWMDDPSNPTSLRGQIRSVLPMLDRIRSNPVAGLARSARLLARDEDFVDGITNQKYQRIVQNKGLQLTELIKEHPAIQLRLLRKLAGEQKLVPSANQVEAFLDWNPSGGQGLSLSRGYHLVLRNDILYIEKK